MNKIEELKKAQTIIKSVRMKLVEELGKTTTKRGIDASIAGVRRLSEAESMVDKQWKLWSKWEEDKKDGDEPSTSTSTQAKSNGTEK